MSEALATLGLIQGATLEEIKTRWRELAKIHHPDCGGDPVEFYKYHQAYNLAVSQASQSIKCIRCNGTGMITLTGGFHSLNLMCIFCGGRGAT